MLTDLTIAEARDALRAKEFSAVDLTMAHLHAIEALNPRLNAFITVSHAPGGGSGPSGGCRAGGGE